MKTSQTVDHLGLWWWRLCRNSGHSPFRVENIMLLGWMGGRGCEDLGICMYKSVISSVT